jgi:hypothetical protein
LAYFFAAQEEAAEKATQNPLSAAVRPSLSQLMLLEALLLTAAVNVCHLEHWQTDLVVAPGDGAGAARAGDAAVRLPAAARADTAATTEADLMRLLLMG